MTSTTSEGSSGGNVLVQFFTTTCTYLMPPQQSYSIPITTLPEGLQQLLESVLEEHVPFDFLINNEFISVSLERFLRRRSMNFEEVLQIEYTPAMQAQEGSKMPHDDWVSCVRAPVCGNATLLLTAAYDHCVRVWSNEECLAIGAKHTEAVKALAVHPDGGAGSAQPTMVSKKSATKRKKDSDVPQMRFVSGGKDGRICAWEYQPSVSQVACIGVVAPHAGSVDSVDISADGKLVASGSWDTAVKLFDWSTVLDESTAADKKAPVWSLTDHARGVLSVRFSATRGTDVLYSSGLDGTVKAWDVREGQLMATMTGDHAVQGLSVMPATSAGADLILAASTDNRVRLYDSRQAAVVKTFSSHRQWVYSAAWLWRRDEAKVNAAGTFATASEDGTLRVWDLRCLASSLLTLDALHTDGVLDVTYIGNNEIASGGKDNRTKTFTVSQ